MNDTSRFMHLKELAAELNRKLDLLQSGSLSKTDLEKLTDQSRDLYERLIVLRFKAYDEEVKGKEVSSVKEEPMEIPSINFKIEEPKAEEPKVEIPVQVSLIDAIEEVTKTIAAVEEPVAQEPAIEEPVASFTPEVEEPQKPQMTINALSDYMTSAASKESLHEVLSKSIASTETLAEKLEHHPITDLKRAITLNQRFQFSKELFKGNNQDYEVAIEKLNNSSRDEAMRHLETLRSKYAWSNDSSVATDFMGLIERRYQ